MPGAEPSAVCRQGGVWTALLSTRACGIDNEFSMSINSEKSSSRLGKLCRILFCFYDSQEFRGGSGRGAAEAKVGVCSGACLYLWHIRYVLHNPGAIRWGSNDGCLFGFLLVIANKNPGYIRAPAQPG